MKLLLKTINGILRLYKVRNRKNYEKVGFNKERNRTVWQKIGLAKISEIKPTERMVWRVHIKARTTHDKGNPLTDIDAIYYSGAKDSNTAKIQARNKILDFFERDESLLESITYVAEEVPETEIEKGKILWKHEKGNWQQRELTNFL